MIAALPSRPGFGEQMAEVVLAAALALPLIFAFAELRGPQLAGTGTEPHLSDTQPNSSQTPTAERPSPPLRVVLSGGRDSETSVRDSRVAVLMEAISLVASVISKTPVEGDREPETSDVNRPLKPIARRPPLNRQAGRPARPSPPRASETPSEPMQ